MATTQEDRIFDLRKLDRPAYYLYRPFSHTDRRQMLSLVEGPFSTKDDVLAAQRAQVAKFTKTYAVKIYRLDQLSDRECIQQDQSLLQRIDAGKASATADGQPLPYVGASWSRRAPARLRLHSRPQMRMLSAYTWMQVVANQPEGKTRHPLIIELVDPKRAELSP